MEAQALQTEVPEGKTVPTAHSGLAPVLEERQYKVTELEGDWPDDLRGTFYRNGPGRQEFAGVKYGHWFDGDGLVNAFHIRDDGIHFVNKWVKTPKFIDEEKAGKVLYRGMGTQIPGGFFKNLFKMPPTPGNTSIIYHGDKLFALAEGWWPFELDTENSRNRGCLEF